MNNKKNILIVSPWTISTNSIGGTERYVEELSSGLSLRGHKVDVLMMSGEEYKKKSTTYYSLNLFGKNAEADEYKYHQYFNSSINKYSLKKLAKKIESLFPVENYDLIQINSLLFFYLYLHKKRIFTIHSNPYELELDWGKGAFTFLTDLISVDSKTTDTFIAPSDYYSKIYSEAISKKVYSIPHSIDIDRFKTSATKKDVMMKYNIEDSYILLVPSRLDFEQKRPQLALEAISKTIHILPKSRIVFTGIDDQYKKYAKLLHDIAERVGLKINIIKFENMSEAYKIADIVILPSQSESFGYSALESIALNKKTILNKIPTFIEIQRGSTNTHFFDNTSDDLANTIIETYLDNSNDIKVWQKWLKRYSKKKWILRFEQIAI